jgi:hypothetical protein
LRGYETMAGMISYTKAAMERAMKVQEVILRAMAKKITWYQPVVDKFRSFALEKLGSE